MQYSKLFSMSEDMVDKMQLILRDTFVPSVYAIHSLHLFDTGGMTAADF